MFFETKDIKVLLDAYVVVNARHQQKNENQPVHIIRVREMEF